MHNPNSLFTTLLFGSILLFGGPAAAVIALSAGRLQVMRVPRPALVWICSVPPSRCARSSMLRSPRLPPPPATAASADGVVCLGGGSVTGAAKAVALRTGLPVVAIPTTYAGSEVTPVWGLSADGRKRTGTDPRVRPALVVYDPDRKRTISAETGSEDGMAGPPGRSSTGNRASPAGTVARRATTASCKMNSS